MTPNSYEELIVWQRSMELVKAVYLLTKLLPESERFGLVSQMQRAAISIPSNIAEGYHRSSAKDYSRFLYIAYGSNAELETQLKLVKMLYPEVNIEVACDLSLQTAKMLNKLIGTLKVDV